MAICGELFLIKNVYLLIGFINGFSFFMENCYFLVIVTN
nr:MAG TPA: hypothetical protein [Caudoviricetes sp.]